MSKGFKKTIAFLFFLLAGIVVGSVIASLCSHVPVLEWLSWAKSIGFSTSSPAVVDLIVFKFAFGFELNVNIAQIFCVIISIIVFNKTCKGM
ncbi:MAG: DUF4321 domain-containing protein [Oscillospiraceae bacterium]